MFFFIHKDQITKYYSQFLLGFLKKSLGVGRHITNLSLYYKYMYYHKHQIYNIYNFIYYILHSHKSEHLFFLHQALNKDNRK